MPHEIAGCGELRRRSRMFFCRPGAFVTRLVEEAGPGGRIAAASMTAPAPKMARPACGRKEETHIRVVGPMGFEPMTSRLKVACSTD